MVYAPRLDRMMKIPYYSCGKEQMTAISQEFAMSPNGYTILPPMAFGYIPAIFVYYMITPICIYMMMLSPSPEPMFPLLGLLISLFITSVLIAFCRAAVLLAVFNYLNFCFWMALCFISSVLLFDNRIRNRSIFVDSLDGMTPIEPFYFFIALLIGGYRCFLERKILVWLWICKYQETKIEKPVSSDQII